MTRLDPDDWIPIDEAPARTGRSARTVRQWVTDRRITVRGGMVHLPTLLDVERQLRQAQKATRRADLTELRNTKRGEN